MPGPVTAAFEPASRADWRRWLAAHHGSQREVWLILARKSSGRQPVSVADAVEEALCFGWIDSGLRPAGPGRIRLRFTPRAKGSIWSQLNKTRVARLIEQGLMTGSGLAVIEAARRDGSWTILDDVENLRIPPDLAAALAACPEAEHHFLAAAPSARKMALWWVASARRPATRAQRIRETVRLATEGRTVASRRQ